MFKSKTTSCFWPLSVSIFYCALLFKGIIKFWLDRGVVGFRFDALRHLYESDSLLDEPCLMTEEQCKVNYVSLNHTYTVDQPETIDIIREWREFVDNYTRSNNRPISR